MTLWSGLRRRTARWAIACVLLGATSVLCAPAASGMDDGCATAFNSRNAKRTAETCVVKPAGYAQTYIRITDREADGLHATAYWSSGSLQNSCDAFGGRGDTTTCPFVDSATGAHPKKGDTVCYRAAAKEHSNIVYLSDRRCTVLTGIP